MTTPFPGQTHLKLAQGKEQEVEEQCRLSSNTNINQPQLFNYIKIKNDWLLNNIFYQYINTINQGEGYGVAMPQPKAPINKICIYTNTILNNK